MPWKHKPDPYKDFKDDRERRLALEQRERWRAIRWILTVVAQSPVVFMLLRMLKSTS
jgi:hypothetical protein